MVKQQSSESANYGYLPAPFTRFDKREAHERNPWKVPGPNEFWYFRTEDIVGVEVVGTFEDGYLDAALAIRGVSGTWGVAIPAADLQ